MATKKGDHRPESEQKTACPESDEDLAYLRNDIADYWNTGKIKKR